jgi:hypothetical protein
VIRTVLPRNSRSMNLPAHYMIGTTYVVSLASTRKDCAVDHSVSMANLKPATLGAFCDKRRYEAASNLQR